MENGATSGHANRATIMKPPPHCHGSGCTHAPPQTPGNAGRGGGSRKLTGLEPTRLKAGMGGQLALKVHGKPLVALHTVTCSKSQPSSLHAAPPPESSCCSPANLCSCQQSWQQRFTPNSKATSGLSRLTAGFICGLHPRNAVVDQGAGPTACPCLPCHAAGRARHGAHLKPVLPGSPLQGSGRL